MTKFYECETEYTNNRSKLLESIIKETEYSSYSNLWDSKVFVELYKYMVNDNIADLYKSRISQYADKSRKVYQIFFIPLQLFFVNFPEQASSSIERDIGIYENGYKSNLVIRPNKIGPELTNSLCLPWTYTIDDEWFSLTTYEDIIDTCVRMKI